MPKQNQTEEFEYILKIPKERVAVLIGKKGEEKKQLEKTLNIQITVDSKEGDVTITGKEALKVYTAREIVRAIGRGFNPDIAKSLLKVDYGFDMININEYAKTKKDAERLKGRVIGQEGKSRATLEELTGTNICVYGKTIGIIGPFDALVLARRAIESLLSGSLHTPVYRWLEKRRGELR
ncbi:KH domain-containing protein [Candidatus Woesearchaeota archaeon]|nr:KH domain-containing protein [Candidatus Woesearchaeota archaeon]MBW3005675.1 KH domain-containing protein [Candidatus Woesearchaeota archaeon]